MKDFSHQLRHVATRLPIPEPTRSRILLEIATDMEDLFHHLVEGGMEEGEAVQAVNEQFDLSDEALRDLAQVHTSPISCSLEGLSGQARSNWERVILGLVVLFVTPGLLGGLFSQPTLFRDASPLAYGLVGILALGLGLGAWKALALFRPAPPRGAISRRGLRALPGLSLLLLLLGFSGIWVELYRSALSIRGAPRLALRDLVEWLHLASATMVVALSGALLTALFWFFLENRAAYLEEKAARALLELST
ncbi:MAG: hypothetical protein ACWGSQ_04235 [Longimicrobiales bacterium]